MSVFRCTFDEFLANAASMTAEWSAVASPSVTLVTVDFGSVSAGHQFLGHAQSGALSDSPGRDSSRHTRAQDLPVLPPCPVVGINVPTGVFPESVDCAVTNEAELAELCARVVANPLASAVLVQLVRQSLSLTIGQALLAESLAYSTLQHCHEFEGFLNGRESKPPSKAQPTKEVVQVERAGAQLLVTLNQPARRNAFSSAMRDGLCEALQLAQLDTTIERVLLTGAGKAFCAGGDLDEFGMARDAGVAHLSRSTLSAGAIIAGIADRVEVRVHGACVGAGIELPAFAGKISAHEDSFFQLPEVSLGLVPGAGGTVSLPRRIGRHRTAWLALSGERIDAATAVRWGLVDELISESVPSVSRH